MKEVSTCKLYSLLCLVAVENMRAAFPLFGSNVFTLYFIRKSWLIYCIFSRAIKLEDVENCFFAYFFFLLNPYTMQFIVQQCIVGLVKLSLKI